MTFPTLSLGGHSPDVISLRLRLDSGPKGSSVIVIVPFRPEVWAAHSKGAIFGLAGICERVRNKIAARHGSSERYRSPMTPALEFSFNSGRAQIFADGGKNHD